MKKRLLSLFLAMSMAFCVTLLIETGGAGASSVPDDAEEFNGHLYALFDVGMTWTETKLYCESIGGHLAVITSEAEQRFIESLIASGTKNCYWLGGYCEADRIFKWVTGEPFAFTNWMSGQPDNYQRLEDRLMIYKERNPRSGDCVNRWNDVRDDGQCAGEAFFGLENFGFICEWSDTAAIVPEPPPTPSLPNNMSVWAIPEVAKAEELGLIPDSLLDPSVDYTQPITRAEFAGVVVRTYENLSNSAALPAVVNPFTDTRDLDVLKAFNTGLMVGVSATLFNPNVLLNREQAATALTRVFKRATMPGWSFESDADYPLVYTRPPGFADDERISDWAKEGVYFMAANGIIEGVGGNMFAPRAVTSDEEARGYAAATREQALAIAVRMIENLG